MPLNKDLSILGDAVQEFQEGIEDVNVVIGRKIRLYPFVKSSGFIRMSEMGERSLLNDPTNQKTDTLIQTSTEPITLYGNNAVNYVATDDQLGIQKIKNPNIDELYYEVELLTITYSNNDKENVNGNASDYQAYTHSRTITCYSKNGLPSVEAMDDLLFVVLDVKNYVGGEQILKITNITPRGNQANGVAEGCEITLQEINLDYSHNAKDLLTFPQFAPMGDNFAFPKETINPYTNEVETSFDPDMGNNSQGVDTIQLSFMGGVIFNSCKIMGRPRIDKDGKYMNDNMEVPHLLFIKSIEYPISSELDVHGIENLDFYGCGDGYIRNTATFQSWRDGAQTNMTNTTGNKIYQGGLWFADGLGAIVQTNGGNTTDFTKDISEGTTDDATINDPTHNSTEYSINDENFIITPTKEYKFDTSANIYCQPSISIPKGIPISIPDLLNYNAVCFQHQETLPISYSSLIRFSFKDIPLVGKLLTFFLGGINPSWVIGNQKLPKTPIFGLIPKETLRMGAINIGTQGTSSTLFQSMLQMHVFSDNVNDFSCVGNKQMINGLRFKLTNRVFLPDTPSNIKNNQLLKNLDCGFDGIGNTKYLGQSGVYTSPNIFMLFEKDDGTQYIPLCQTGMTFADPLNTNQKGAIDGISYKVVGQCEVRLTAYDVDQNNNNISIGENRHLTNAKGKNDQTLGTNSFKLNFIDRNNTIGALKYPQEVNYPMANSNKYRPIFTLTNDYQRIILDNSVVVESKDKNNSQAQIIQENETSNILGAYIHYVNTTTYTNLSFPFQYWKHDGLTTNLKINFFNDYTGKLYSKGDDVFGLNVDKDGNKFTLNIPLDIERIYYDNRGKATTKTMGGGFGKIILNDKDFIKQDDGTYLCEKEIDNTQLKLLSLSSLRSCDIRNGNNLARGKYTNGDAFDVNGYTTDEAIKELNEALTNEMTNWGSDPKHHYREDRDSGFDKSFRGYGSALLKNENDDFGEKLVRVEANDGPVAGESNQVSLTPIEFRVKIIIKLIDMTTYMGIDITFNNRLNFCGNNMFNTANWVGNNSTLCTFKYAFVRQTSNYDYTGQFEVNPKIISRNDGTSAGSEVNADMYFIMNIPQSPTRLEKVKK